MAGGDVQRLGKAQLRPRHHRLCVPAAPVFAG